MVHQQKSSRKLYSHFLSLFAFMLIVGIALGLFGTPHASAAVHTTMGQASTTYKYALKGDIQGDKVFLTMTSGSGILGAVWSNNKTTSQDISNYGGNYPLNRISKDQPAWFYLADSPSGQGSTYYQVFDEQGTSISNQVGISIEADGTGSVFCDIEGKGHHGACSNNASNKDQSVALECIDSPDLNCAPDLTNEVV